ncbi:group III truncated hemoglobin [Altererythrobacter sp. Z27]|uniref:group III truncated hemoglobin n=1 Tax=Altererythrobacter sp. Z27 TaxID=3461147 RepID=UPI0040447769
MARNERRLLADQLGINSGLIDRIVERFYASVREDELLAPIFAARVADWPHHLARMKLFWAAVLRGEGGFAGNPMLKHAVITGLGQGEFDRWLALFERALALEASNAAAAQILRRAEMIAASLRAGIERNRSEATPPETPIEGANHA